MIQNNKRRGAQYQLPTSAVAAIDPQGVVPSAMEIEQSVLGVLLSEASSEAAEAMLILTPSAFFDPTHALIFEAMRGVEVASGKVDLVTVAQQLKTEGRLRAAGGVAYLTELTQKIGSGSHIENHVRILLQMQIARQIMQASYSALRSAIDEQQDIADTIDNLLSEIENAQLVGMQQGNRRHISAAMQSSIAAICEREKRFRSGQTTGITTGLGELDRITNGWHGGELVILAARPAMGKTAIALHLMRSAAVAGVAVCMYSLEMSASSLCTRMLAGVSSVSASNLRSGRMSASDWTEVATAEAVLNKLPIHIDDKSAVSMNYIATHSRIMHRRGQCSMIIIDYLQLMDMRSAERGRNREQEVAATSAAAKRLAKDLNIPVIMIAQLSRAVEGRGGTKEPILSDLRESGAIEQDADVVMFVHRDEYYKKEAQYVDVRLSRGGTVQVPAAGFGKLIIAKNREGATGAVGFTYNESLTHITDFDETPYLTPALGTGYSCGSSVGNRPVSSNSMHYVAPTPTATVASASDDLPF